MIGSTDVRNCPWAMTAAASEINGRSCRSAERPFPDKLVRGRRPVAGRYPQFSLASLACIEKRERLNSRRENAGSPASRSWSKVQSGLRRRQSSTRGFQAMLTRPCSFWVNPALRAECRGLQSRHRRSDGCRAIRVALARQRTLLQPVE